MHLQGWPRLFFTDGEKEQKPKREEWSQDLGALEIAWKLNSEQWAPSPRDPECALEQCEGRGPEHHLEITLPGGESPSGITASSGVCPSQLVGKQ